MELLCPHCRSNAFKVSGDGTIRLECLTCGRVNVPAAMHRDDAATSSPVRRTRVGPRLQWITK
jgi:hypothetical protein